MAGSDWRWFPWRQRQSEPAILTSSHHNTLYNAPTILKIKRDLGVVDFPELLWTHTVSQRLFWKWNNSLIILFSARTKKIQRTRTCKQTNTILMYKKAFNKVRKRAKIRNRYNQAPYLTQDTNGKVTTSQLDITNEGQEVSPFPAGVHKASINRRIRKHNTKQDRYNINDPQKKQHAAQQQFLRALKHLNRESMRLSSFSPFWWVYFSSL